MRLAPVLIGGGVILGGLFFLSRNQVPQGASGYVTEPFYSFGGGGPLDVPSTGTPGTIFNVESPTFPSLDPGASLTTSKKEASSEPAPNFSTIDGREVYVAPPAASSGGSSKKASTSSAGQQAIDILTGKARSDAARAALPPSSPFSSNTGANFNWTEASKKAQATPAPNMTSATTGKAVYVAPPAAPKAPTPSNPISLGYSLGTKIVKSLSSGGKKK